MHKNINVGNKYSVPDLTYDVINYALKLRNG